MKHRPLAKKVVIYAIGGARHVSYVNAESAIDAATQVKTNNTLIKRFPECYHISYVKTNNTLIKRFPKC